MALSISESDPPRRIMALPGDPDATSVALKPRAIESMATKTATTPAMPSTAMAVEAQRTLTLRTL
jgi:hypothetical protein